LEKPQHNILRNKNLNDELVANGFVKLPILDAEEVEFFKSMYEKWHPESPENFYKSYFSDNVVYKREVEDAIIEKCKKKLEEYFYNYHAFGGMFVVKPKGDEGHITPHQDWSFVEESKNWSLNMWLPLKDVDSINGTIRFLRGSHLFMDTIRGFGTPKFYDHLLDEIEPQLEDINLKAGEAVFFYHSIVHCSHYNQQAEERVCLGLSMVEKAAPIYFHFLNENEQKPDKYKINNTSFYFDYTHARGSMPQGAEYVGKEEKPFPFLSKEEMLEKIAVLK